MKLQDKKGFICDMDGVIYHGNELLPGVKEFIRWLQDNNKKFLFLTNSSVRSPKELAQKLSRMGMDIDPSHFYCVISCKTKARLHGICNRRIGAYKRTLRYGYFNERRQPRLCCNRRRQNHKLQYAEHHKSSKPCARRRKAYRHES